MYKKDKIYRLSDAERLKHYNINYDIDRFEFMSLSDTFFEKVLNKVQDAMTNYVGQKPYSLNWEEIIAEYIQVGQSDVPHFASQYVFAKFLLEGRSHEKKMMQEMYLEIVAVIISKIERGILPTRL